MFPCPRLVLCLQHGVTLVPVETFSLEFVEPRVRCVSRHGVFSPSRCGEGDGGKGRGSQRGALVQGLTSTLVLHPRPQYRLPALSLPEAGPAHPPQGLPGAAAGPRPPAGPVTGPRPRRTPVGAPAAAPHCRGPGCGAHAAAPSPGEGPGQEGRGADGDGIPGPQPCPGPHPCICSPEPLLPCRAPWSSALTCLPWAAMLSCCTASSPSTPPSPWRSLSAGAGSGKVSGPGGPWRPWGQTPGTEAHRGSSHKPRSVVVVADAGRSVLLSVLKRGPGPSAHSSPSLLAPAQIPLLTPCGRRDSPCHTPGQPRVRRGTRGDGTRVPMYVGALFLPTKLGSVPSGPSCVAAPDPRRASGPCQLSSDAPQVHAARHSCTLLAALSGGISSSLVTPGVPLG